MKVPKKGDRVLTHVDSPLFEGWRGIEAVVLHAFEHPAGNLQLEIRRSDGEKGYVSAEFVDVIVEAPPEVPRELPRAEAMWVGWARGEIKRRAEEIARLEKVIRDYGEEP